MRTPIVLAIWLAFLAPAFAEETPSIAVDPATLEFSTPPGLPTCARAAPLRGDPRTGPSVLLVKLGAGCRIPWHWHTANEQVMFVSGSGTLEMKGEKSLHTRPGAYAFLPGHHIHRVSCSSPCTIFNVADGPFDIHYVDDVGNEIDPPRALHPPRAKKKR